MQLHERVVRPCLEPKTYGRKPGSKVMPKNYWGLLIHQNKCIDMQDIFYHNSSQKQRTWCSCELTSRVPWKGNKRGAGRSSDDIHWRHSVCDPCKDVMRLKAGCGAESTPLCSFRLERGIPEKYLPSQAGKLNWSSGDDIVGLCLLKY